MTRQQASEAAMRAGSSLIYEAQIGKNTPKDNSAFVIPGWGQSSVILEPAVGTQTS